MIKMTIRPYDRIYAALSLCAYISLINTIKLPLPSTVIFSSLIYSASSEPKIPNDPIHHLPAWLPVSRNARSACLPAPNQTRLFTRNSSQLCLHRERNPTKLLNITFRATEIQFFRHFPFTQTSLLYLFIKKKNNQTSARTITLKISNKYTYFVQYI